MEDDDIERSINVDRPFLGKAGEYLTAGKLLLNGFNVFAGAIDDGIDIVASKNNNFFKIQVKTCQDVEGYDSGRFVANVNLSTLSRHNAETTFVVFVVHYLEMSTSTDLAGNHSFYRQDFIVLPVSKLFEISESKSGNLTVRIKSGLILETEEMYLYKLSCRGKTLLLDDYLIESFSRITNTE